MVVTYKIRPQISTILQMLRTLELSNLDMFERILSRDNYRIGNKMNQ